MPCGELRRLRPHFWQLRDTPQASGALLNTFAVAISAAVQINVKQYFFPLQFFLLFSNGEGPLTFQITRTLHKIFKLVCRLTENYESDDL